MKLLLPLLAMRSKLEDGLVILRRQIVLILKYWRILSCNGGGTANIGEVHISEKRSES
jgi:hypothetical protein